MKNDFPTNLVHFAAWKAFAHSMINDRNISRGKRSNCYRI